MLASWFKRVAIWRLLQVVMPVSCSRSRTRSIYSRSHTSKLKSHIIHLDEENDGPGLGEPANGDGPVSNLEQVQDVTVTVKLKLTYHSISVSVSVSVNTVTVKLFFHDWVNYVLKILQNISAPAAISEAQIDLNAITLTLTLTLILLQQPETTAIFGSIHRLCHSNYDLSTPTLIRSSAMSCAKVTGWSKVSYSYGWAYFANKDENLNFNVKTCSREISPSDSWDGKALLWSPCHQQDASGG
jgi:hypothetical protein